MSGELFNIIYQFFLSLFSNDISFIQDAGYYEFNDWLYAFFGSFIGLGGEKTITELKYAVVGNPENYTITTITSKLTFMDMFSNFVGGGDSWQVGEVFISGVLTCIVGIILIVLLFKLFKWIFNLIFKLFRLN